MRERHTERRERKNVCVCVRERERKREKEREKKREKEPMIHICIPKDLLFYDRVLASSCGFLSSHLLNNLTLLV